MTRGEPGPRFTHMDEINKAGTGTPWAPAGYCALGKLVTWYICGIGFFSIQERVNFNTRKGQFQYHLPRRNMISMI